MKSSKTIIFIFIIFVSHLFVCATEGNLEECREKYENGFIEEAIILAQKIIKMDPDNVAVRHILIMSHSLKGNYDKASSLFYEMDATYAEYNTLAAEIMEAHIHSGDIQKAYDLAEQIKSPKAKYYKQRIDKPLKCIADKTSIMPFVEGLQIPSDMFPAIQGRINGKEVNLRFDTGGTFMVMPVSKAEELGISMENEGEGLQADNKVKTWSGIAEKIEIGDGIILENVPVIIMESPQLEAVGFIIFGTNLIEQFLCTVDYPNSRLILSPRNNKELCEEHISLMGKKQVEMPFYMWSDHFIFGKGIFADQEELNFHFDSGLLVMGQGKDGNPEMASCSIAKDNALNWTNETNVEAGGFLINDIGIKGLIKEDALIFIGPRPLSNFGGVRIDGTLSHGFVSNYAWTIDFKNREFIFGTH